MSYSITEFEHIYTENILNCMRLAISLLGDEDDARDVVQDVFLKLWETKIDIDNPQAFVIRSVRNACLDRIKSIGIKERVKQRMMIEPVTTDEDIGERQKAVLEAIERLLPEKEKLIIDKVYDEGLSYKAAAESLNVSVSTVNKSLTIRTRQNSSIISKHFTILVTGTSEPCIIQNAHILTVSQTVQ